jgi:hypothetical protein
MELVRCDDVQKWRCVAEASSLGCVFARPPWSQVRHEDVHAAQQLEFFARSASMPTAATSAAGVGAGVTSTGAATGALAYADRVHALAGAIGTAVWRLILATMAAVRATGLLPGRFPPTYVSDRLWDARRGYSDTLKARGFVAVAGFLNGGAQFKVDLRLSMSISLQAYIRLRCNVPPLCSQFRAFWQAARLGALLSFRCCAAARTA